MDPVAHLSVAMAASKLAGPAAPWWVLGAATQVPDLLFFGFEAAGWEKKAETKLDFKHGLRYLTQPVHYLSHGLLMTLVWSVLAGAVVYLFYQDLRTSIIVGTMVMSHWILDAIVYPNLSLAFENSPKVGLGLITSRPGLIAGIILEVVLIAGGFGIFFFA